MTEKKNPAPGRELTYSEYINVPALLRTQTLPTEPPRGHSPEDWPARPSVTEGDASRSWTEGDPWPREWPHEELLFIVTHQTFELWFKQILHDLDDVMRRAHEVVAVNGGVIPRADLGAREPGDAPPLRRSLASYPRSAAVIDTVLRDDEWERRWALELHEPGAFPGRGSKLIGALSLAWFDEATLSLFARRVARASKILRHVTGGFDVLATMPPEEFLAFRSRLSPASGFGSTQFREIEISLGLRDMHVRKLEGAGDLSFARHMPAPEVTRMRARAAAPSLRDLVYALLNARDVRGTDAEAIARADRVMADNLATLHRDFAAARAHGGHSSDMENHLHGRWRTVDEILTHAENVYLVGAYTRGEASPALRDLLERCLDLDEALRAWRNTHIPLVERIIGARPGTGGGGVGYLATTLQGSRVFPCLWEFRSVITPSPPRAVRPPG